MRIYTFRSTTLSPIEAFAVPETRRAEILAGARLSARRGLPSRKISEKLRNFPLARREWIVSPAGLAWTDETSLARNLHTATKGLRNGTRTIGVHTGGCHGPTH